MPLEHSLDDLNLTPERVWDFEVSFNTLITDYRNGAEQRRGKGLQRRRWMLEYRLTETEIQTLFDFFIAREGRLYAFCWTDTRNSTTYPVRFDHDTLKVTSRYDKLFIVQVTLIQVIGEECA